MRFTLGNRLTVGQQTLNLPVVVRIHVPQPRIDHEEPPALCRGFCFDSKFDINYGGLTATVMDGD